MAKNSNGVSFSEGVRKENSPVRDQSTLRHEGDNRAHDALNILFGDGGNVGEALEQIIRDLYNVPEGVGANTQNLQPDWGVLKQGAESNQYSYNSLTFTSNGHYTESKNGLLSKTNLAEGEDQLKAIFPRFDVLVEGNENLDPSDSAFNAPSVYGTGLGTGVEGVVQISGGTNKVETGSLIPRTETHAVVSGAVLPANKGVLALTQFLIAPNDDDQKFNLFMPPNPEDRCIAAILLGGGIATGNDGESGNLFQETSSFPSSRAGQYDLVEIHEGKNLQTGNPLDEGANIYAGLVRLFSDPRSSDIESPIPILGGTATAFGGGHAVNFFGYRLPLLTDYSNLTNTPAVEQGRFFDAPTLASTALTSAGNYTDLADQDPSYTQIARFRHRFEVSSDTAYVLFHFKTEESFEALVRDGEMPSAENLYGLYTGFSTEGVVSLPSSRGYNLPLIKNVFRAPLSVPNTSANLTYFVKPVERTDTSDSGMITVISDYGEELSYQSFWAKNGIANVMGLSGVKYLVSKSRLHPTDPTGGAGDSDFKDYGNLSLFLQGGATNLFDHPIYDTNKTEWSNSEGQTPASLCVAPLGLTGILETGKDHADLVNASETLPAPASFNDCELVSYSHDGSTHASHYRLTLPVLEDMGFNAIDPTATYTNSEHLYIQPDSVPVCSHSPKVFLSIHRPFDYERVDLALSADVVEISHTGLTNNCLVFSGSFKINSEVDPASIDYSTDTHYGNFLVGLEGNYSRDISDYSEPLAQTNINANLISVSSYYTAGAPLPSLYSSVKDTEERFLDEVYRLDHNLSATRFFNDTSISLDDYLAIGSNSGKKLQANFSTKTLSSHLYHLLRVA